MVSLVFINSLIFIHFITNVHSQGSPGDILGTAACDCYGMNNANCGTPDVPVENLPKECTSYLYMFIDVKNNTLVDQGEQFDSIAGYLDQLIKTNTTVLVHYYHDTQKEWCAAVQCDTAGQTKEMNNLKEHLDKHPGVKGIILRGLMDLTSDVKAADCPDYTQKLKAYIDLMRKTFPDMSIGMHVNSKKARDTFNKQELAWLDYKCLEPSVDFFIVNFNNLNKCTDEFTETGAYPLSGNNDNSVEAMKTFLDKAGIPSSKVHYSFYNFGDVKDVNRQCDVYPTTYCKGVKDANTAICADTLQTLSEKGAFAKANGAGFVVSTVDSDDYDCSCQCGQSFPGFYALLSGYKGGPPPPPCALFDRTKP